MSDRPPGRIKQRPEDFVVEEIPAYEPVGQGSHVFVRFVKTDRTTMDAVSAIARALGCDPRGAGFAGMKDKRAVTTQTASFEAPRGADPLEVSERARALAIAGVSVLDAKPHGHKMRPGHLAGNRFAIAVRGVPAARTGEVTSALDRLAAEGVPNAFGEQRYGRGKDNASRALAWLRGEQGLASPIGPPANPESSRRPRDPRIRRLLWSSLQSAVFDAVLRARIDDGTWATPLEGDLLKLRSSGGLFLCADVQTDQERAVRGEVSPTGPIVGARMRSPEGAAGRLEQRISLAILGGDFDLARVRKLGEGSRRVLRVWVEGLRYEIEDDPTGHGASCIRVYFVLPKGTYATTVLRAAVDLEEEPATHDDYTEAGRPPSEDGEAGEGGFGVGPRDPDRFGGGAPKQGPEEEQSEDA